MKSLLITCVTVALTSVSVRAEIEPIMLDLTVGTYTVPNGRVLAIQNVFMSPDMSLTFSKGTTNVYVSYDMLFSNSGGGRTVSYPLVVPENTVLSASGSSAASIFGLLVSPTDLFVGVDHSIDKLDRIDALSLALGLKTKSAQPLRFKVDSTDDLRTAWVTEPDAVVVSTADKTKYSVTVPKDGTQLFYRTRAFRQRR